MSAVAPSPDVASRIEADLVRAVARCREFFGDALVGLYLGGGYGRGEGGRRLDGAVWLPENDYDLMAVVRGGRLAARSWRASVAARLIPALQEGQAMEHEVGVLGRRALAWKRPSQLLHDLRQGHRVLWGEPAALLDLPTARAADVPRAEGLALLVNRGALLLLAARVLDGLEPGPAAVRTDRFLHKARLAVGDAWLLLSRRHHHLLRVRAARVADDPLPGLPDADAWRVAHAHAAAARLEGFGPPPPLDALAAELALQRPRHGAALAAALAAPPGDRWGLLEARRVRSLGAELVRALDSPGDGRAACFIRRWRGGVR